MDNACMSNEVDRRMLLLGRQAPPSNVHLALPAHEVYAVECNKSISLINARVQRHFPHENYRVDPAEDMERKTQQLAEQAAKAEAANSFHRMVKKRAAEVHKNLRMQKLLPVKEVEQRKVRQNRLKEYSRLVADRNLAMLRVSSPGKVVSPTSGPASSRSRPTVSDQSRHHACATAGEEQDNDVAPAPSQRTSMRRPSVVRHKPEVVFLGSDTQGSSTSSLASPDSCASAHCAAANRPDSAVASETASDVSQISDLGARPEAWHAASQLPDGTSLPLQSNTGSPSSSAPPPKHPDRWEGGAPASAEAPGGPSGSMPCSSTAGSLEEASNAEEAGINTASSSQAGAEPAAAAVADAAPEGHWGSSGAAEAGPEAADAAVDPWQRMEVAVQAARSRLASLSTASASGGPASSGGGDDSGSCQAPAAEQPAFPHPTVWAPRHPGLPTTPVPRTIRILRASAGTCNHPSTTSSQLG